MGSASGHAHLDFLLYAVFPYIAFVLFIVVTVQRYRQSKFTYSSLSSQFLENRQHFWGMVPFHYGILFPFAGLEYRDGEIPGGNINIGKAQTLRLVLGVEF